MENEEIVRRIQSEPDADHKADYEQLYTQNAPLIRKICYKFTEHEEIADLMQTAFFGLVKAVEHYDSSRGVKFMSYATYWIEQELKIYLMESRLIRTPSYMNNLLFRYRRLLSEKRKLGHFPDDTAIMNALAISERQLRRLKEYASRTDTTSLDAPIANDSDGEATLADFLPDTTQDTETAVIESEYHDQMKRDVSEVMQERLTEQEQNIIYETFWRGKTLGEIASTRGITPDKVRWICDRAKRKIEMSARIRQRYLDDFSPTYYRRGVARFNQLWNSTVESEILAIEDRFERMERRAQRTP